MSQLEKYRTGQAPQVGDVVRWCDEGKHERTVGVIEGRWIGFSGETRATNPCHMYDLIYRPT